MLYFYSSHNLFNGLLTINLGRHGWFSTILKDEAIQSTDSQPAFIHLHCFSVSLAIRDVS